MMILMDTGHIHSLAEQIHQAGFDTAAEVVAAFLASPEAAGGAEGYRDGIEDALNTLVRHGATDPR
jgi:hypothetical protein